MEHQQPGAGDEQPPELVRLETQTPIPASTDAQKQEEAARKRADSAVFLDEPSGGSYDERLDLNRLDWEIKTKKDEIQELLECLEDAKKELGVQREKANSAEEKRASIQKELDGKKEENRNLKQKLHEEKFNCIMLEKQVSKLESDKQDLEKRLSTKDDECKILKSKVEQLKNKLKEQKNSIICKYQQRISQINREKQGLLDKCDNLSRQCDRLVGDKPYKIPHPDPEETIGAALIISIREVETKPGNSYAEKDEDFLAITLDKMRFRMLEKVVTKPKNVIDDYLEKLNEKLMENDKIFLCYISSHGGCDAKSGEFFHDSEGGKIYLEEVYKNISKCDNLKGKPKILVVNACLGKMTEEASEASETSALSDFLILFSSAPRYESYDHEATYSSECSFFVETLCTALNKWNTQEVDLETAVLDEVHRVVQAEKIEVENYKGALFHQCPFILSSLRGRIMLKK